MGMKVINPVVEVSGEGLESLIGQEVLVFCGIYIYHGKLVGVNTTCIKLLKTKIVYETGPFTGPLKDAQLLLPSDSDTPWYIQTSAIESFGARKG